MDIFADFDLEYSIEWHNLKIQTLYKNYLSRIQSAFLFNYNKKYFEDAIFT